MTNLEPTLNLCYTYIHIATSRVLRNAAVAGRSRGDRRQVSHEYLTSCCFIGANTASFMRYFHLYNFSKKKKTVQNLFKIEILKLIIIQKG